MKFLTTGFLYDWSETLFSQQGISITSGYRCWHNSRGPTKIVGRPCVSAAVSLPCVGVGTYACRPSLSLSAIWCCCGLHSVPPCLSPAKPMLASFSELSHAAQGVQLTSPPPALEMSLSKQTSALISDLSGLHAFCPTPPTYISVTFSLLYLMVMCVTK